MCQIYLCSTKPVFQFNGNVQTYCVFREFNWSILELFNMVIYMPFQNCRPYSCLVNVAVLLQKQQETDIMILLWLMQTGNYAIFVYIHNTRTCIDIAANFMNKFMNELIKKLFCRTKHNMNVKSVRYLYIKSKAWCWE